MPRRRPTSYRSKKTSVYKGNRVSNNGDTRTIKLGKTDDASRFPDNEIISSKYTIWTFLPKNLFEQFRRIANFYFLCMAIIAFAVTSPVSPLTSLLPLMFVVIVTGVKQAYEDFLRHRADKDVNNFQVTVVRGGKPQAIPAKKIQVGDIVRVNDEQDIPCDIVLLVSSHKESKCFVTTANLDGETNLKTLYCPKSLKRTTTPEELGSMDAAIECESPHADLYKFHGRLEYGPRTSNVLRQSMIKRAKSVKSLHEHRGPACCFPQCTNCDFKRRRDYDTDESSDISMQNLRCYCQCRTRGILPVGEDDATQALRTFESTVRALEEETLAKDGIGRRSSSLSTESSPSDEPLTKISSNPEMGRKGYGPSHLDSIPKSALKKKHKKTDSNVSRVSFNVNEPFRRESVSSTAPWTLQRKETILSRRNSSLLSSKRPSLMTSDGGLADPLGAENILLRGARLKNTTFVYGCAVYTGQDTKLALNSKITSNKFSTVESSVNKFLLFYLIFLIVEVIVSTILKSLREVDIGFGAAREKTFKVRVLETDEQTAMDIFEDFLGFVVLYNYVIPISLYVTMEMQKFLGTLFFEWDLNMYDSATEEAAICNTSDLNEDLGQIEFLFSDKTGTLTENIMQFRKCSIDGMVYLQQEGALYGHGEAGNELQPIDLTSCEEAMEYFLLALSLCHTAQVEEGSDGVKEEDDQVLKFNAASPDEKALVEAMQRLDIVFTNDEDDLIVLRIFGVEKIYKRLEVLEFSSDRKRMSVIVENEEGTMFLFCKGAESAVLPLVHNGPADETMLHVADFASQGLRTLVVGYRSISDDEYTKITLDIQKARQTLSANRDSVVARTYAAIENGLTVLGATGVEDKLQDCVQPTLESLRSAGIKVWILTGDKVETAVNISMSCGHFKPDTIKLQLIGKKTVDACIDTLTMYKAKVSAEENNNFGLVVDGESLTVALRDAASDLFREVCMKCTAVICCRMSPLQKSEVVRLVKTSKEKPVTAAIGDGANDVSMIQEAHVGIGIMGKEGRQAVRCADFAFSRFKFVREALLVHGHWYYLRVSTLVQYFFYKNIVFILPQFYFLFHNGYSTQPLYDSMYLTCYNIFFTSLPILVYGLLEQNYPAEQLRSTPSLYSLHSNNCLMTWRHFFKWFFLGAWHSIVIYFGPALWFSLNSNMMQNGFDSYLELFGTHIFHCSVVVVNLKLWLHSRYWCLPFIGSLILSFLLWILLGIIYCVVYLTATGSIYKTFLQLLASPSMWLNSLLVAAVCLIPDIVIDASINSVVMKRYSPFSIVSFIKEKTNSARGVTHF